MTDNTDLPPELLERVAHVLYRSVYGYSCPPKDMTDAMRSHARAVAPLLIAHGRELAGPLPHGTMVRKKDGHEFEGHFLCEYTDMKGRVWWMVELSTPGAKGLMFHFRREQMEPFDRSKP